MSKINGRRVMLGGGAAALVLMVTELGSEPFFGAAWNEWLSGLGLPALGEGVVLAMAAMALVIGVITVGLYAALQPRYGAGMRTAVRAGLIVWALNCLLPSFGMYVYGILPAQLFWIATLFPLVQTPLAAIVGARLYREPDSMQTARAFASA